jgi:hypothetical protein
MGWKEGAGLGSEGDGRRDPVLVTILSLGRNDIHIFSLVKRRSTPLVLVWVLVRGRISENMQKVFQAIHIWCRMR